MKKNSEWMKWKERKNLELEREEMREKKNGKTKQKYL